MPGLAWSVFFGGPLSEVNKTRVFSSRPLALRASRICPTDQSISAIAWRKSQSRVR
jgi:hypothetical protein